MEGSTAMDIVDNRFLRNIPMPFAFLVRLRHVLRQCLQPSRRLFFHSRSIALVVSSSSPSLAPSIASWYSYK